MINLKQAKQLAALGLPQDARPAVIWCLAGEPKLEWAERSLALHIGKWYVACTTEEAFYFLEKQYGYRIHKGYWDDLFENLSSTTVWHADTGHPLYTKIPGGEASVLLDNLLLASENK